MNPAAPPITPEAVPQAPAAVASQAEDELRQRLAAAVAEAEHKLQDEKAAADAEARRKLQEPQAAPPADLQREVEEEQAAAAAAGAAEAQQLVQAQQAAAEAEHKLQEQQAAAAAAAAAEAERKRQEHLATSDDAEAQFMRVEQVAAAAEEADRKRKEEDAAAAAAKAKRERQDALAAAAFVARRKLKEQQASQPAHPPPSEEPEPGLAPEAAPTPAAPRFGFGAGVVAGFLAGAVLLGAIGIFAWPRSAPAPVAEKPAATTAPPQAVDKPAPVQGEPAEVRLTLESVSGTVERLSPDGEWVAAAAKDSLGEGDHLRAGADGAATLASQPGDASTRVQIALAASSQLSMRRSTTALHRLRLVSGIVKLGYSKATGFVVETRGGQSAQGDGAATLLCVGENLSATCASGSLEIGVGKKRVAVPAGSFLTVRGTEAPPAPSAAAAKLQLTLDEPAPNPAAKKATLSGRVNTPALLTVAGAPVTVDRDGRFTTTAALKVGRNVFAVVARDVAGGEAKADFAPVNLAAPKAGETPAPKKGGDVIQWGGQ
jgi:hypothetical protein